MQAMGGLMAAWELWEKALVPSLLNGAGTWIGDVSKAANMCDDIQNFFWRVVLSVPESCPKLALRCETGMLGMKWRIWLNKIMMLVRIKCKEEETLCKQIYEEEKLKGWPGLSKEVTKICDDIGIPDVNHQYVPTKDIKQAIVRHHYADMKTGLDKSTKLESIKNEAFTKPQSYMHNKSIENGRLAFRIRSQMVDNIPANLKNKFRNDKQGLICKYCPAGDILSQSHCLVCTAWQELRVGLDLNQIEDLTIYFRKLLTERAKMDKKEVKA
jgi:hypothetical protein